MLCNEEYLTTTTHFYVFHIHTAYIDDQKTEKLIWYVLEKNLHTVEVKDFSFDVFKQLKKET